ncbi:MAG: hypothetical protein AAFN77_01555 [Planctomycetota bacterium]
MNPYDEQLEADPNPSQTGPEPELSCDKSSSATVGETTEVAEAPIAESSELVGYALVDSLMKRQDEVIIQLDDLNEQIEAMIKSLAEEREAERMESESESIEQPVADDVRRAA